MDLDAETSVVLGVDIFKLIGLDVAVVEVKSHREDLLLVGLLKRFVEDDLVDFLLVVGRVGELLGDLAVVGEHQHTGGVLVEPSDREHPQFASPEKIHDGLLGVRVAGAGDKALRLVHHDVDLLLALEPLAIEADIVVEDVDLRSKLGHNLSVDGHDTGLDEVVSLAA